MFAFAASRVHQLRKVAVAGDLVAITAYFVASPEVDQVVGGSVREYPASSMA